MIEVFAEPQELMAGTVKVGDPIAVLPTLFHLLWAGALNGDLGRPLRDDTVVSGSDA